MTFVAVPEYEVVTPVQTDHKGDYLSHDLDTPHTRARREEHHLIQDLPAHFEFTAFGERHQMTVKPNTGLLAPGFFMQVYGDNGTVQTDFEVTLCHYVGNLTSHSAPSHVAISNCKGLVSTLKQPIKFMHIILCMCECIVLEPIWVSSSRHNDLLTHN